MHIVMSLNLCVFSDSIRINSLVLEAFIDAVPSRTNRPRLVSGLLLVPGLLDPMAVARSLRPDELVARAVPARAKPNYCE